MVSVSEAEGEGTGAKLSPASENPSTQTLQAVTSKRPETAVYFAIGCTVLSYDVSIDLSS
jgi:hypothetical protein